MSGIKKNIPPGALAVPPGAAVYIGNPEKSESGPTDHILAKAGLLDLQADFRIQANRRHRMFQGNIAVQSVAQSFDVVEQHIGIQWMAGAGGRHGADRGQRQNLLYALGAPQQPRHFLQG